MKSNIWRNIIQNTGLNGYCGLCGQFSAQATICPDCNSNLSRLVSACYQCGSPTPGLNHIEKGLCGRCQSKPPAVDHSVSAFHYETPVDFLLQSIKFQGQHRFIPFLAMELAQAIKQQSHYQTIDVIIPVPLHSQRLRSRGYNQALEIAKVVAKTLDLPIDYNCCVRPRANIAQADLLGKARLQNMHNVFAVRRLPASRIALIDDVMTTGATLFELAHCLKIAGANYIEAWVCARSGQLIDNH